MPTKPRLLFRADAGHEIGFGHVARMCALIEEAEAQGYEPVALFHGDHAAIKSWAADRKITVELKDWSATAVVQAADHPRVTGIVIDGPELARTLIPKLPDRLRTVVIDDAGKLGADIDAIVNHNVHAPELAASYPQAKLRLLGRRYLMLRKDIRRYTRGSCRPTTNARLRVVVTFGGSDPVNATARTLMLIPPDRPLELVVVAGPGFQGEAELRYAIELATANGHSVDLQRAPEDPGALFVSADAAICSAGGTLGELAFLGCPALAYAIVRDQLVPARQQVRSGLIAGGRSWADSDDEILRSDMFTFLGDDAGRATMRKAALATADGDGPRRIIEEGLAA